MNGAISMIETQDDKASTCGCMQFIVTSWNVSPVAIYNTKTYDLKTQLHCPNMLQDGPKVYLGQTYLAGQTDIVSSAGARAISRSGRRHLRLVTYLSRDVIMEVTARRTRWVREERERKTERAMSEWGGWLSAGSKDGTRSSFRGARGWQGMELAGSKRGSNQPSAPGAPAGRARMDARRWRRQRANLIFAPLAMLPASPRLFVPRTLASTLA